MCFLYCFYNVSLTQRVLVYLVEKLQQRPYTVTVIFLYDYWVVQVEINAAVTVEEQANIQAFLDENGTSYQPCEHVQCALDEIFLGDSSFTDVMNRHHVAVVLHGKSQPESIQQFQKAFVDGLGYCPPSLF